MKHIYWLVVSSLLVALCAVMLFVLLALGQLSEIRKLSSQHDAGVQPQFSGEEVCDFDSLEKQAMGIVNGVAGGVPEALSVSLHEDNHNAPMRYGELDKEALHVCEFVLTYEGPITTDGEREAVSTFEEQLRGYFMVNNWSNETIQEVPVPTLQLPVTLSLAHAGGPMAQSEVFIHNIDGYDWVQFATISNHWTSENRVAFMEGSVESPCPCSVKVQLTLSAPLNLTKRAQELKAQELEEVGLGTVPIAADVCEEDTLRTEVGKFIAESLAEKENAWELHSEEYREQSINEYARVSSEGNVRACEYEMVYILKGESEPSKPSFEDTLVELLREAGWNETGTLDLKSEGLGKEMSLSLASGGRTFSSTDVYAKFYPDVRAVQFAHVRSGIRAAHIGSPDPCPCEQTLTLSISGIVALAPYFEKFGKTVAKR